MAVTKIWPVRDNLGRVLDYAENHLKTANPEAYSPQELNDLQNVLGYAANADKTSQQFFVTGVNCIGEIAYEQMIATKQRFGKTGGNLAYHAYQSFAPDEVTPEQCHRIGVALAKRLWGDRYEVLVTTHLNTHCVHNHLVVNSVSRIDGKKLNNNYAMYFDGLRKESDNICREHGFSVVENPGRSGNRYVREAEKRGEPTMWNIIRSDIDEAVRRSVTDRQFYQVMRQWGYTFDFNPNRKYPTLRAPGTAKATRFKTLGEHYTPEAIVRRILAQQIPNRPPPRPKIQQYQYKGSFRNMQYVSGLYVLFLIFTLLLRKIRNINRVETHPQKQRFTPEMREAVRRMERYSDQTRLLCRYKLKTDTEVTTFVENKKEELSTLERSRNKVYSRMKSAKTPKKLAELKSERDELSKQITALRKEVKTAQGVLTGWEDVRRKIREQRELDKQYFDREKQQSQQRKRGHEHGAR